MKKRSKWWILCLAVMMTCSACGKESAKTPDENLVENNVKPEEGTGSHTTEKQENLQGEESQGETPEQLKTITVYGYGEQGEMIPKEVEVEGELSEAIISELQKLNVLPMGVEVLNLAVNESEKRLDLDVNSEFGNYIRSMGTFGETVTIECFARTFTKAYDCIEVKITENGSTLESGHAIYEGYIRYE